MWWKQAQPDWGGSVEAAEEAQVERLTFSEEMAETEMAAEEAEVEASELLPLTAGETAAWAGPSVPRARAAA